MLFRLCEKRGLMLYWYKQAYLLNYNQLTCAKIALI